MKNKVDKYGCLWCLVFIILLILLFVYKSWFVALLLTLFCWFYYRGNQKMKTKIEIDRESCDIKPEYRIEYIDEDEKRTTREISPLGITASGNYIQAFCHLRNEERTFNLQKILSMIDLNSGEVIDAPKNFFRKKYDYQKKKVPDEVSEKILEQKPVSYEDNIDNVDGKKCCFTGKFSELRSDLEARFEGLGAVIQKAVTDETDYLIVGGEPSRDWKFSSAGRKIEHAVKNRISGRYTAICSEKKMNEFLGGL